MRTEYLVVAVVTVALLLLSAAAVPADEAPIAGAVKSIDATSRTLTVETTAKGQTRTVVIDVKSDTKIVRFARAADGKGFAEQAAKLEDLKPGWTVSVKTRHQGDREVAELVRVVHEK